MKPFRLTFFILILCTGLAAALSPSGFYDLNPETDRHCHGLSAVYLGYGFFVPPHTFYPVHSLLHYREMLKLSTDQVQSMERAALDYKQFYLLHSARIKIQELELLHLLKEDAPDRHRIREEMEKTGEMKVNLVIRYFRHLLEIRSLLTAEQLEMMKKLD